MQALMSGQAAVAVIISLIQVIVAALSLDDTATTRSEDEGRAAEENSASLFFFLTTAGMLIALLTHVYLVRMPVYRNVAAPFEAGKVIETEEEEELMTSTVGSLREIEPVLPVDPRGVSTKLSSRHKLTSCRIGRQDQPGLQPLFDVRVRCYTGKRTHYNKRICTDTHSRHCSPRSLQPCTPLIRLRIRRCPTHYSSTPFTF